MHRIAVRAFEVFGDDVATHPAITLRGGAALDGYSTPPGYDPAIDEPTDAYLEKYAFEGLSFLDPPSWRHYLPYLIDFALRHLDTPSGMTIEGLLWSLRPPDRLPARLASLSAEQEAVIVDFLDCLASESQLPENDFVLQVMEEWWLPNALYRPARPDA